jgi:hypothetical protein
LINRLLRREPPYKWVFSRHGGNWKGWDGLALIKYQAGVGWQRSRCAGARVPRVNP